MKASENRQPVVAILPMRGGSVRIARKNLIEFQGRPLYHHIARTLLECSGVERLVIDSDDTEILADAQATFGGEAQILRRPEHLGLGEVPMNSVLQNVLDQTGGSAFLQTHATNPLLSSTVVDEAISAYAEAGEGHDSLFSVTERYARFWMGDGRPVNHSVDVLLRTQDLPPLLEENSCIYIFERSTFLARSNRVGTRPLMYPTPLYESIDIDTPEDLLLARAVAAAVEHAGPSR